MERRAKGTAWRTVFFGTPDFAVPTLERLARDDRFKVALVVTRPDRPAGRGQRVASSPVGIAAAALRLPVYRPVSLREAAARQPLAEAAADLFVVAAYGLIFGPRTLALPRLGCVNVHASLLPRYRGASPIAAAIMADDERTGITLMRMEPGLDTGPIIAVAEEAVRSDDTTATLTERLGAIGAGLVIDEVPRFAAGERVALPQGDAGASLTRPLSKADGWLDWREDAAGLERRVRAMWPWPRAWTTVDGDIVQVHRASVVLGLPPGEPGRVLARHRDLTVACGRDALVLEVVQPAGGRPMSGATFLAGRRSPPVEPLGAAGGPQPPPPLVLSL